MGSALSTTLHKDEMVKKLHQGIIEFTPQPQAEVVQLDTEVDQRGNTTVNHLFKRTREVYGQPAKDLGPPMDWSEFVPNIRNRPTPFNFPAFEHEEMGRKLKAEREANGEPGAKDGGSKPKSVEQKSGVGSSLKEESPKAKDGASEKKKKKEVSKPKAEKSATVVPPKTAGDRRSRRSGKSKKTEGTKGGKRIAANDVLDNCSVGD